MIYHYEWAGYKYPVSAETVGKYCREIEERDGAITKKALVESARDSESEIHGLFEWDDKIAGEKYRLYQAGVVLSSLKITVTTTSQEPAKVRGFIQTSREDQVAQYRNVTVALSQETTRKSVLEIAKKELFMFAEKYRLLKELSGVLSEIEKLKVGDECV